MLDLWDSWQEVPLFDEAISNFLIFWVTLSHLSSLIFLWFITCSLLGKSTQQRSVKKDIHTMPPQFLSKEIKWLGALDCLPVVYIEDYRLFRSIVVGVVRRTVNCFLFSSDTSSGRVTRTLQVSDMR